MSVLLTLQPRKATHCKVLRNYVSIFNPLAQYMKNTTDILEGHKMAGGYDDRDGHIWMDGKMIPWRDANVHILTHAMHYASSVFEGERAYNGKIFKSRLHSERLKRSAEMVDFEVPYSVDELEAAKAEVLKASGLQDAYIRVIAWRGAGEDMGVASSRNPVRVAIAAWEWGAYYGDAKMKGAKLDISKWKRPSPETIPSHAKAAGLYMICTMSKHAAEAKGCSDAMMYDYRGYVAEATGANIFFVKNGEVHTPDPDCFLNGITRQTVIGMLKERGITVHERHIMPEELEGFEQCWLTGTAAEVTPVGQIGEHTFEVGALTRDIAESYEKLVRE
jgi:branched-chain amino acid aminotransferase